MWMYKPETTPPTRVIDCPVSYSVVQQVLESYITTRIFLAYRPEGYVGEYNIRQPTQGLYVIRIKTKIYGGIVWLDTGEVWSFYDRNGVWLPAKETQIYQVRKWVANQYIWEDGPIIRTWPTTTDSNNYYLSKEPAYRERINTAIFQYIYKSEEGDMDIVTGYIGEPHITAQQDRDTNMGIIGPDTYILNVGQNLACEIVSAQEVRIRDGALSLQGCVGTIPAGAYDSLTIANGSQGMKRIDLICAQYWKNQDTNAENISLVVKTGEPASSDPVPPAYISGDIRTGAFVVEVPLYRVDIDGVNIQSVNRVAKVMQTLNGVDDYHAVKTITGIGNVTASSGITINTVSIVKNEYMAQCYVSFTHTAAWTANTAYDVGTLAEGFRPRTTVIGKTTGTPDVNGSININGLINCVPRANRAANTREYVSFPLYFLQD